MCEIVLHKVLQIVFNQYVVHLLVVGTTNDDQSQLLRSFAGEMQFLVLVRC